jgi:hypothetical protein
MSGPAGKDSEDLVLSPGRGIRHVVVWAIAVSEAPVTTVTVKMGPK